MAGSAGGAERRLLRLLGERRRALGLSLPQLAAAANVDRHRLQRLLTTDGAHLRFDEVAPLIDALELSMAEAMALLWPDRPLLGAPPDDRRSAGTGVRGGPATDLALGSDATDPQDVPTSRLIAMLAPSPRWSFSVRRVHAGPSPEVQVPLSSVVAALPAGRQDRPPDFVELRQRFLDEFGPLPSGIEFAVWRERHTLPGRFPHDPRGGHPMDGGRALYLESAIYSADRPAGAFPTRLRGVAGNGVVILALRVHANSPYIAVTVARALGWAYRSTRRATNEFAPLPAADPRERARSVNRFANLLLGEYLAAPPPLTVMNHVGTPVTDVSGTVIEQHALLGATPDVAPFVVVLRESDAMLAEGLARPVSSRGDLSRFSLAQLLAWRDALVRRGSELEAAGRGVVLPLPDEWAHADLDAAAEDALRWRDQIRVARQILQDLLHRSGIRGRYLVRDPLARALLSYDSPLPWR